MSRAIATGLLLLSLCISTSAQGPATSAAEYDRSVYLAVNQLGIWIGNNGMLSWDSELRNRGLEFPLGSGKGLCFVQGLLYGHALPELCVGGATYRSGMQGGNVLSPGVAADPALPVHRPYTVLKLDLHDLLTLPLDVQQRLRQDFADWPVALGAPWVDVDGDAVYEPDFDAWIAGDRTVDHPRMHGDGMVWFVNNDLDETRMRALYGTAPAGVETRTLVWGSRSPAMERSLVFDIRVVNTGTQVKDSMYLAWFADPDLGDGLDDCIGYDAARNMAYVYNGRSQDDQYGIPPAMGWRLLQGPVYPAPGETARFDGGTLADHRNLPWSAFSPYIKSSAKYGDPDLGDIKGAGMVMYNFRGLGRNGDAWIDSASQTPTAFPYSGDPVTRTGWFDGVTIRPGDRRFLISSGPFPLAAGAMQQIIIGLTVALGEDNLGSVTALREQSDAFVELFNAGVYLDAEPLPARAAFSLDGLWPQPAREQLMLRYSVDGGDHIRFELYDVLGRCVRSVEAGRPGAGAHNLRLALDGMPPGAYMLFMRGDGRHTARLMMLR